MYDSLKSFVARRGGRRLAMHGAARDRMVEMAVEEFPVGSEPVHTEEVLRARLRLRVRQQYGSVIATILIGVMVSLIVKLVMEWWFERRSHRVLMEGWHANAVASAAIPPAKADD